MQAMKQQRVRLMKQLKAESEQFRRTKATMAREMLQLKSQVMCLHCFDMVGWASGRASGL